MRLIDLKGSSVTVAERGDERLFLEDLFELHDMGESVPELQSDASDYRLYDSNYRPVHLNRLAEKGAEHE